MKGGAAMTLKEAYAYAETVTRAPEVPEGDVPEPEVVKVEAEKHVSAVLALIRFDETWNKMGKEKYDSKTTDEALIVRGSITQEYADEVNKVQGALAKLKVDDEYKEKWENSYWAIQDIARQFDVIGANEYNRDVARADRKEIGYYFFPSEIYRPKMGTGQ